MNVECWLIVNSSGSVSVRKTKPNVKSDEIPVLLDIHIPDALFERPRLRASISVPEEGYMTNPITTEAINNIRDEIEHRTGLDFDVRLIHTREEEESQ